MRGFERMREKKAVIGLGIAILLFLGLTGMVRFPSVMTVSRTKICLPDRGKTKEDYVEKTDCWGVPFIYRSCTTDWELKAAEPTP